MYMFSAGSSGCASPLLTIHCRLSIATLGIRFLDGRTISTAHPASCSAIPAANNIFRSLTPGPAPTAEPRPHKNLHLWQCWRCRRLLG